MRTRPEDQQSSWTKEKTMNHWSKWQHKQKSYHNSEAEHCELMAQMAKEHGCVAEVIAWQRQAKKHRVLAVS